MGSSYRGRSRSYSPPRRSPIRRRYDDPPQPREQPYSDHRRSQRDDRRSQRDDRRSPGPSGLLVRNISLTARPEDLRARFESFGPVKDVYLPKNYYTGEQRGFGFVKFRNADDAAEAKYHLNHTVIGGREIAIVFAAEKRKTPHEMRRSGRVSGHHGGGSNSRRSPSRSSRRYQSYSRSPSPAKHEARGRDCQARGYYSPSRSRSISRSASPRDDGAHRPSCRSPLDKREHGSDRRSPSPQGDDPIPHDRRDSRADRRSPGGREDERTSSRARPQSLSRSYSPR